MGDEKNSRGLSRTRRFFDFKAPAQRRVGRAGAQATREIVCGGSLPRLGGLGTFAQPAFRLWQNPYQPAKMPSIVGLLALLFADCPPSRPSGELDYIA